MKISFTVLKLQSRHDYYTEKNQSDVIHKIEGGVTVLVLCILPDDVLYLYQIS